MAQRYAGVQVYSTIVPVPGWRSAALLGIAVVLLFALPEARLLTFAGLAGGVMLGVLLAVVRARAPLHRGDGALTHLSS